MKIAGTSALVTGGASGLGGATARRLVAAGAYVVIADLNREAGLALASELGASAQFVETNVTDAGSMEHAIAAAASRSGGIRILVSCAGIGIADKVIGKNGPHDLDQFNKVIQVNLIGTFNALRLAAAAMANNEPDGEGERGVIINTASVAAFEGQIGQVAYSASKGGIV
jgi:NAD(P)-dependent dehydrogenase (short-subunit alcohol dehydrogenase family)